MTERLDPHYAATLMAAAVTATGQRPKSDQGGWMKAVLGNAALIAGAITAYNENPTQLERALNVQRFRGVLLSVQPREDGRRLEVTFLPLIGKYAGKWVNPRAKVPPSGPVPMDYAAGYEPAIETWSGPWIRDGQCPERKGLEAQMGRAVVYTAHRERDGEEGVPKGGYRVFDDVVEGCDVPSELEQHVGRILKAWNVVAHVDQRAATPPQAPAQDRPAPPAAAPAPEPEPSHYEDLAAPPAEPPATYTEEEMAPFPTGDDVPPPATVPATTTEAPDESDLDGDDTGCDLPDEIWGAQQIVVALTADDLNRPPSKSDRDSLDMARGCVDRRLLAQWASQERISYVQPRSMFEFTKVVDAIAGIYCGRIT